MTHSLMESIVLKHFAWDVLHVLRVKKCVLLRYFSMSLIVIDAKKLKWKHSGKCRKHALEISPRSSPLAKASRWNLSKFVVIKHFG